MARSIVDYEGNEQEQQPLDPMLKEIMERRKRRKKRVGYKDEAITRRLSSYAGHNLKVD